MHKTIYQAAMNQHNDIQVLEMMHYQRELASTNYMYTLDTH